MINYVSGNIFESTAQTIVNPINCVGVMGAGLARQFRDKYPDMFKRYRKFCLSGLIKPGNLMLYKSTDYWILNFPTKNDWRAQSQIEFIESGLQKFVDTYKQKGITSIAFTKLGCGLGGLDWICVKPIMEKYLNDLPIDVFVYE